MEARDVGSVIDLLEKVRTKIEEHLQTAKATRNSLLELTNGPNTQGNLSVARTPSTELVRLAQSRLAEADATVDEEATGIKDPERATEQDLLQRIDETAKESATMRQGLAQMTSVVVSSAPAELIRLVQEKFRALSTLAEESSNEVNSLRHHKDDLQASLEQERIDRQRENSVRNQISQIWKKSSSN